MDKLIKLVEDIGKLIVHYYPAYLTGIRNTLILAVAATLVGCIIGLVCGVLNTIPYTGQDHPVKRFFLKLIRIIVRIYVEVFRGTPMVLQAVFIYYGLPYFTDGSIAFKGNSALKDAMDTVLADLTAEHFNLIMNHAISVQPEI